MKFNEFGIQQNPQNYPFYALHFDRHQINQRLNYANSWKHAEAVQMDLQRPEGPMISINLQPSNPPGL